MLSESPAAEPFLVVGGGVAGISAALDLARAGRCVHLVERGGELGGQTLHLDKLYPTDHCGFCPVWSEVRLCQSHPRITVHTWTRVARIEAGKGFQSAVLSHRPNFIDPQRCIFCGRCAPSCAENAVAPSAPHVYPPLYRIDPDRCTGCGACREVCPTGAIDLERPAKTETLRVQAVIWATGFEAADLSAAPELGFGSDPNIMQALAFEQWIAEAGPNRGRVVRHDGRTAREVAFIQCAGARDRRIGAQCNAVCCMHALKQARWVRRRNPQCRCTIFFTDLRTEGRGYEAYYRRAVLEDEGIELVRARPGLICPLPGGAAVAVKYEDTFAQKPAMARFDMVVLNGTLRAAIPDEDNKPLPDVAGGFIAAQGPAFRSCGFCKAPADVEAAAVQGSAAAMEILAEVGR